MSDKITVNIHGSCVTRDSFEEAMSKYDIEIVKYVSRNSIFSVICDPLSINKEDYTASKPYLSRMIAVDFKKELFSYLKNNPTDYLIIDLIDERFKLLKFVSDKQMVITDSSNFRQSDILTNHPLYSTLDYYLIDTAMMSDSLLLRGINEYCRRIMQIYSSDQIIINEAYLAGHYIGKDGDIHKFKDTEIQEYRKLNEKLKKMYSALIRALHIPDFHIIKQPKSCYASETQKWGLAPFHYFAPYYENVVERFLDIARSDGRI